jgi:hypothetical protein
MKFNNFINENEKILLTIVSFLLGSSVLAFKYISGLQIQLYLIVILGIILTLLKVFQLSRLKIRYLKNLLWIFIPLFVYSFFLDIKVVAILMIANLISDPLASIIRTKVKPFRYKIFPKDLTGSLVFILSFYLLSLGLLFFLEGALLKKYIIIFLINAFVVGYLENSFHVRKYPDNFNINIFGSIFLSLSLLIDFSFRFRSMDLIFGLIICPIILFLLIVFDIIKLKGAFKYFLFFELFYTGFGYKLFVFNIIILTGMGVIKKITQYYTPKLQYNQIFIDIDDTREYFFLSFIIVLIYFIMPQRSILKMSLIVGLTTALLHYFYYNLNHFLSKTYFHIKHIRISKQILLYNVSLSLVLLFTSYILNIMKLMPMIYGFVIINLFMFLFVLTQSKHYKLGDQNLVRYMLPYFSFKIFFLFQLL